MRTAVMLVSMLLLAPWSGCPQDERPGTFKFVEVTGKKVEIFAGAVRIGQTGDIIPIARFGAGVTALARGNNRDGTTEFSLFPDVDTPLVFKHNGAEVRITEEDWRGSSRTHRVVVKIRVLEDSN